MFIVDKEIKEVKKNIKVNGWK